LKAFIRARPGDGNPGATRSGARELYNRRERPGTSTEPLLLIHENNSRPGILSLTQADATMVHPTIERLRALTAMTVSFSRFELGALKLDKSSADGDHGEQND